MTDDSQREALLARLREYRQLLPEGFRFDRPEANERDGGQDEEMRPPEQLDADDASVPRYD